MQNGVQKVLEMCTLAKFCVGNIDCLEDGYELGNAFKNATDCVVSCCEGDNCDPPVPLKCHQCQGKGDSRFNRPNYMSASFQTIIYFCS